MRRSISALVLSLALVLAACTSSADTNDSDDPDAGATAAQDTADEEATAEATEEAAEPAATTGPFATTVTDVPLDVDALAGTQPVQEAFTPSALEVVGTSFHAFGSLATPDGASMPAIYRSLISDGLTWEPIELELGDDIVAGSVALVDAPSVTVLRLRDGQDRNRVELIRRANDVRPVAVIDDADLVFVSNVAVDGDGFLAVGSRQDGTERRPALWSIQNGEATAVELPDDERVQDDQVGLDVAVVHDGRYRIAGSDGQTDEVLWLEGPALDDLEVVDVPDGLDGAQRLSTMLVHDDVLWIGGRASGSVSGELAVWSQASSDAGFEDRTDTVWADRERFSSSASRLTVGNWRGGEEYLAVVEGSRTLWWTTEGGRVTDTGAFGGTLAAYSSIGNAAVTYDGPSGSWRVGFEEAEVSLPLPLFMQDAPALRSVGPDGVTITIGASESARTLALDADGRELGEVGGSLSPDRRAGLQTLTGTLPQFALQPAAARIVDGALVPVELPTDDEPGTARAMATLTDGTEELIVGHRFLTTGLAPLAWTLQGTEATPTDRFDDVLTGRGFSGACGPSTVITYDELDRIGVAWPFAADGPVDVVLEQVLPFGTVTACVEAADGRVWVASDRLLLAVSEDGTVDDVAQPELRSAYGLQLIDVDGAQHLVAFVNDETSVIGNRLWTVPLDDLSAATTSERIEMPSEVGRPGIQGFDEATRTYTFATRVGTVYRVFELTLDPA